MLFNPLDRLDDARCSGTIPEEIYHMLAGGLCEGKGVASFFRFAAFVAMLIETLQALYDLAFAKSSDRSTKQAQKNESKSVS